jgi:hypothetical protein
MMAGVKRSDVPRPASDNDDSVALRLPKDWLRRAEALIESMSRPGIGVSRSDVLRAALAKGLVALEAEAAKASSKPSRRK